MHRHFRCRRPGSGCRERNRSDAVGGRSTLMRQPPMGWLVPLVCPSGNMEKDALVAASLARGTEVDRFIVLGLLGRGAMGEVYAAHDPELDRKIAIKLLRAQGSDGDPADAGRARLIREAQAIAKVSHPNVVVVYDVGTFEGRVFIAMEFIAGHTLGYWLQAQP